MWKKLFNKLQMFFLCCMIFVSCSVDDGTLNLAVEENSFSDSGKNSGLQTGESFKTDEGEVSDGINTESLTDEKEPEESGGETVTENGENAGGYDSENSGLEGKTVTETEVFEEDNGNKDSETENPSFLGADGKENYELSSEETAGLTDLYPSDEESDTEYNPESKNPELKAGGNGSDSDEEKDEVLLSDDDSEKNSASDEKLNNESEKSGTENKTETEEPENQGNSEGTQEKSENQENTEDKKESSEGFEVETVVEKPVIFVSVKSGAEVLPDENIEIKINPGNAELLKCFYYFKGFDETRKYISEKVNSIRLCDYGFASGMQGTLYVYLRNAAGKFTSKTVKFIVVSD